jgi:hypothetical protein
VSGHHPSLFFWQKNIFKKKDESGQKADKGEKKKETAITSICTYNDVEDHFCVS